jgi:hypothetical protein
MMLFVYSLEPYDGKGSNMSDEEKPPASDKNKGKIVRAAATAAVAAAALAGAGATAGVTSNAAPEGRPAFTVQQLDEMLASANLDNSDNVHVVAALEVDPGTIFTKQYDR